MKDFAQTDCTGFSIGKQVYFLLNYQVEFLTGVWHNQHFHDELRKFSPKAKSSEVLDGLGCLNWEMLNKVTGFATFKTTEPQKFPDSLVVRTRAFTGPGAGFDPRLRGTKIPQDSSKAKKNPKITKLRTSLVVKRLRIRLLMKGTWVPFLVRKVGPTCTELTGPYTLATKLRTPPRRPSTATIIILKKKYVLKK